jgi:small subunit ribosomal protein S6
MTLPPPIYDLVLMLDPQAEPETRAKIVADTVATVQAGGELLRQDDWGERPLTYPIEKRTSSEYHLLQFHIAANELLDSLDRTLRITDGVLRFRIIKLKPGVPEAPDMSSSAPPRAAQQPDAPVAEPHSESTPPEPDPEPAEPAVAEPAEAEASEASVAEPA